MTTLRSDVRYAVKTLLARPGFTLIATATLALGIGANSAIFSVVDAVLLRPLPYVEADDLVVILATRERTGDLRGNIAPADFLDFEREATSFERMGALGWVGFTTLTGSGEPERLGNVSVTWGFLPTLGIEPALGRAFRADEDLPGGDRTALISHGLWGRRFGNDPNIVGTTLVLDERPTTVIGVLPASYRHIEHYPEREADIFTLHQFEPVDGNRGGHFIRGVGRLRAGVTLDQARAELRAIAGRLEAEYPLSNTGKGATAYWLKDEVVGASRTVLLILLGAVGLVLVIACTNIAGLLLSHGTARRKELGIRTALGASPWHLARQLITESVVLSSLGGACGLVLAFWATRVLSTLSAETLPRADAIAVDGRVLAFTVVVAAGTGLAFGLAPALQAANADLNRTLSDGTRGGSSGGARRGVRHALVVGEVALALMLLVGAGLLIRSLSLLVTTDPGFAVDRVLTSQVSLPRAKYPDGEQVTFYRQLMERLAALPGVSAVGGINILPLTRNYDGRGFQIDTRPMPPGENPSAQARTVTPAYFQTMGMRLIRGRLFDERDNDDAPLVVVISEAAAREFWPGEDPIGTRLTYNAGVPTESQQVAGGPGSREIVGIVSDVKHLDLADDPEPFFYTPYGQIPRIHDMTLAVRSQTDPEVLADLVRREVGALDADLPVFRVQTVESVLATAASVPRFRTLLLSLFAGLALLLTMVGVYGVIGHSVSQRTAEIGLRMALGASRGEILRMVLSHGMAPVLAGVAAGLVGSVLVTRFLASLLYGVSVTDGLTFVVAPTLLVATALVASYVPARRAIGVDPGLALRGE